MTDKELYTYSVQLNALQAKAVALLNMHYTRYKHFVDSSESGLNCTYAKHTKKLGAQELSELESLLTSINSESTLLLKRLQHE